MFIVISGFVNIDLYYRTPIFWLSFYIFGWAVGRHRLPQMFLRFWPNVLGLAGGLLILVWSRVPEASGIPPLYFFGGGLAGSCAALLAVKRVGKRRVRTEEVARSALGFYLLHYFVVWVLAVFVLPLSKWSYGATAYSAFVFAIASATAGIVVVTGRRSRVGRLVFG